MPWNADAPERLTRAPIRGWGDAPLPLPTPDPVAGWFLRTLKAQELALLDAEGALTVDILARVNVDAALSAAAKLTAGVDAGDGLSGTMWERYLRSMPQTAVASLAVAISQRVNAPIGMGASGSLAAALKQIMQQPVPLGAVGALGGTMQRLYVAPTLTTFTTTGAFTYTIPAWCDRVDVIAIGGGGSGKGLPIIGAWGNGGGAGVFASATVVRGTTIAWGTTQISGTVGSGGPSNGTSNGISGAASTAAASGWAGISGAGGAGGTGTLSHVDGYDAGTHTFNGQNYVGGNGGSAGSGAGNAPGGGGGGATVSLQAGGAGARGQVWCYAYQVT